MRRFMRLTAMILSVCTLVLAIPFSASAATEGDFEYTITDNEATITAYTGSDAVVTIPDTLGSADVTVIGAGAFSANTTLQSITFPDTLKIIQNSAFNSCSALTAVSFPNSVETIETLAFFNCTTLSDIVLSPYTYDIGYHAFHNTNWYRNVDAGVVYLGRVLYTYAGTVPKDTVITVEYGTAAIAPYAFANRTNLKGVNLNVGLRKVGEFAFIGCTALEYVRIPPSVTDIGDSVLSGTTMAVFHGTDASYAAEYASANKYHLQHDSTLDYLDGDMNKNGKLNSSDIRTLLCIITGATKTYDIERYWSCDLKYDGVINSSDVRALLFKSLFS